MSYNVIPLFVILPLAAAFINSALGGRIKKMPAAIAGFTTLCLVALSAAAAANVCKYGALVYKVGIWKPPMGITMVADSLAVFMLSTVSFTTFMVMVYSVDYMERYTAQQHFYTLALLMLAGMNGVIMSGDIFNLFVFLEIASVASYGLVAFGTEKEEIEAAFKYLVMSAVGSLFILLGIAFIYSHTSTLNMADIAAQLARYRPGMLATTVSVFFIMGFGLKAALVPFHSWLPDAHPSAPAPISAMLSGALIKSLGVYTLIRVFYNVLGVNNTLSNALMFMGALSMLTGVFLAIGQFDFKRLLAHHSISQVGYIILGIGLGTPLGILGGLFHLFNHSVFKSLLFLNSGAVEYAAGTRDLNKMGGLNEKMPVTGGTSLFASMAIAGVPPFNGFFSKLLIIFAAVQANRPGYALCAVLASILTLASFAKVQKFAFFGKLNENLSAVKEVPLFMRGAMIAMAVACLVGGLLLTPALRGKFLGPAADAVSAGTNYAVTALKNVGP